MGKDGKEMKEIKEDDPSGRFTVVVRSRPLSKSDIAANAEDVVKLVEGTVIIISEPSAGKEDDYLRANRSR
jgi:hypothetical protein